MDRPIFVGLPVADLDRTTEFFTALGLAFDPNVTGPETRRMIVNDGASVMFYSEAFFTAFTSSAATDTATSREVAIGLSALSRDEVDEVVAKAIAAGGRDGGMQDQGWMYMHAFLDLDGHRWSSMYMEG